MSWPRRCKWCYAEEPTRAHLRKHVEHRRALHWWWRESGPHPRAAL